MFAVADHFGRETYPSNDVINLRARFFRSQGFNSTGMSSGAKWSITSVHK
jgi:hypothetical protein